jgi:hypothetical protein
MPVKKKRAARPKKRKYTQKQKQKQKQSVNVKVSTGSGGGGTSFIPMPQAPAIDYAMLSQYLRPPNTVDVPIAAKSPEISAARTKIAERLAMRKPEDLMPNVRSSEQASMGPLQGGIAEAPVREKRKYVRKEKSVMGAPSELMRFDEPMGAVSEGEGITRTQQYYRGTGFIPQGSVGKGKRVQYEEDIFGRSMPRTSDIRGSSSFESSSAPAKSKVVSMSDLMSSIGSGGSSSAQQTGGGGGLTFAN